jgi:hypothetical protein
MAVGCKPLLRFWEVRNSIVPAATKGRPIQPSGHAPADDSGGQGMELLLEADQMSKRVTAIEELDAA